MSSQTKSLSLIDNLETNITDVKQIKMENEESVPQSSFLQSLSSFMQNTMVKEEPLDEIKLVENTIHKFEDKNIFSCEKSKLRERLELGKDNNQDVDNSESKSHTTISYLNVIHKIPIKTEVIHLSPSGNEFEFVNVERLCGDSVNDNPKSSISEDGQSCDDITCNKRTGKDPLKQPREKVYKCGICFTYFNKMTQLDKHMKDHTGKNPYKCPICCKNFTGIHYFRTHMRIHAGEHPYKCKVCSKSFRIACTLKTHMRLHTGEKPYQCEICNRSFIQHVHLKVHMGVHSREKAMSSVHFRKVEHATRSGCKKASADLIEK